MASIAISFVNGAVRTTHQLEMARLLRRKSRLIVAFGAVRAAGRNPRPGQSHHRGGHSARSLRRCRATRSVEFRDDGHTLTLPKLFDSVFALDRAIPVDYYVPGCPPSPKIVADAFQALLGDATA